MRNYIQPGNTLTLTAPAAIVSGDVVAVGSIIGVANGDAANGAPVDVDTVGVFRLPKVAALAIAAGDVVYWVFSGKAGQQNLQRQHEAGRGDGSRREPQSECRRPPERRVLR